MDALEDMHWDALMQEHAMHSASAQSAESTQDWEARSIALRAARRVRDEMERRRHVLRTAWAAYDAAHKQWFNTPAIANSASTARAVLAEARAAYDAAYKAVFPNHSIINF